MQLAVHGEAPDLRRRKVLGDLRDVMQDVDLELLHRSGGYRGQRRVDLRELLERDALGVGQRRSGRLRRGHRKRLGGRGDRRRGRLIRLEHAEDGDHDRHHRDQDGQSEPDHQPLAPGTIVPELSSRDLDLHRRSLVESLGDLIVDGFARRGAGSVRGHLTMLSPDGPYGISALLHIGRRRTTSAVRSFHALPSALPVPVARFRAACSGAGITGRPVLSSATDEPTQVGIEYALDLRGMSRPHG